VVIRAALIIAISSLFYLPAYCAGQTDIENEIKTKGYINGNAIMKFFSGDENGKLFATQFIAGVLEGMTAISGGRTIKEIYPDCRREDVIRAVIEYYTKNPSKRYRPVVDVILSGCK
jgi:hypothetical protein